MGRWVGADHAIHVIGCLDLNAHHQHPVGLVADGVIQFQDTSCRADCIAAGVVKFDIGSGCRQCRQQKQGQDQGQEGAGEKAAWSRASKTESGMAKVS